MEFYSPSTDPIDRVRAFPSRNAAASAGARLRAVSEENDPSTTLSRPGFLELLTRALLGTGGRTEDTAPVPAPEAESAARRPFPSDFTYNRSLETVPSFYAPGGTIDVTA
jgi:hypothetical protein